MNNHGFDRLLGDSFLILIPVYNDWEALELLIQSLDSALTKGNIQADVLIVNDGSTLSIKEGDWAGLQFRAIRIVECLDLARNLGHQRAIAVGLAYIHDEKRADAIIIMDADGEDDPEDVPRLIETFGHQNGGKIVFAQRIKRSEGWIFRAFYSLYKGIYRTLIGSKVRFGNFSIVPGDFLPKLVVISEIWNHFAAGVVKAKIPYAEIPTKRSSRLAGRPRMSFVPLVIHGLGAISVNADVIGVRALVTALLLILISIIGILIVVAIRTFTSLAIPGWASFVTLSFLILLTQAVMMAMLFIFIILNNRSGLTFIPRRDYRHFLLSVRRLYQR